ncbi:hypothetical protein SAMN02745118_02848, partial [Selenihalanaerobacter shriftii]
YILIFVIIILTVALINIIAIAKETKSIENLTKNNNQACIDCHQFGTNNSLKKIIPDDHMPVNNLKEEGVNACLRCHGQFTVELSKIVHKAHLVGNTRNNEFLAGVKEGENSCITCHELTPENGEMTITGSD